MQRPGQGLDDLAGGVPFAALLQPGAVVGADSGQDSDLLAPQPAHPAAR